MLTYGYKAFKTKYEIILCVFEIIDEMEVYENQSSCQYTCNFFKLLDYDILTNRDVNLLTYEEYENDIIQEKLDDDNIDKTKAEFIHEHEKTLIKHFMRRIFTFFNNKKDAYEEVIKNQNILKHNKLT